MDGLQLQVRRNGSAPVELTPSILEISPDTFGVSPATLVGDVSLQAPDGWRTRPTGQFTWNVTPGKLDLDQQLAMRLVHTAGNGRHQSWHRALNLTLDITTTFDPEKHAFPFRNSSRVLGNVKPNRELFTRTYRFLPRPLANILYRGLYADIVYLGGEGQFRGGLCSGMARQAGLRSLQGLETGRDIEDALESIIITHGRQLKDRALLAGLPWLLRGSPTAAFRIIRDDALSTGQSTRAIDLKIPKIWRRDFMHAIVREGHSVVPMRIQQHGPDFGSIDVYDPNKALDLQTIAFRLKQDRYAYPGKVDFADNNVGMIAAKDEVYKQPGTAFIATLGSVIWLALKRVRT